jgi:uncharacterized protein YjdB
MIMRRQILLLVAASAAIAIAACDQAVVPTIAGLGGPVGTDTSRSGNNPSTSALIIAPSTIQLGVGATFQFGTNAPLTQQSQIEWSSLNPAVVAMSPAGVATAIAPGSATITARFSFDTGHVALATVTVTGIATGARAPGGM